jgi:hypothetical protein
MRLPGFTAESSYYKTSEDYSGASAPPSLQAGSVVPQHFFCHGNFCCDEWGNCIYKGKVFQ